MATVLAAKAFQNFGAGMDRKALDSSLKALHEEMESVTKNKRRASWKANSLRNELDMEFNLDDKEQIPLWRYNLDQSDLYRIEEANKFDGVDTYTNRESMMRESANHISGLGLKASNMLFTTCQKLAYAMLREWHDTAHPEYLAANDRSCLKQQLFSSLVGPVSKSASNPKQAQAVLYRVTSYASRRWDANRAAQDDTETGARARNRSLG